MMRERKNGDKTPEIFSNLTERIVGLPFFEQKYLRSV